MNLTHPSTPRGVRAVIFDISGTTLDFGSRGPVAAFVELFARHGVAVSSEEARRPMGTHKLDHIWTMLNEPSVAARWEAANESKPTRALLDQLYAEFTPLQREVLKSYCDVIPGLPRTAQELRSRGIKIANTTGFDRAMMTNLIPLAAAGGYSPDLWVCPDDVGKGRPAPWMAFHAARQLDVYPMSSFVKVGDTPVDVAEGHAAGMWVVSVVRSGNEVGLSETELAALPPEKREARISAARARLAVCGPHYLIDTAADLIPVVDEVSTRIVRGERP
ncbi:MAG: phosphonoacetaldehyde hydrolase [Verrucomicrobiota bacterium]